MTVKNGKRRENSLARKVVSVKKPSTLEKIIETVPKPEGAIPNFGLPKWKLLPLESKIPMIPGPKGAYNFTRRKLGKKLWVQTKDAEFNLNDPCNYEMEFSYDPLHDEHLTRYFSRKSNVERMIKLGFVTKNLDAKCSLRDYNMYRKFLKKLHNDGINRELKRRSKLADEKRVLEFADCAAEKDIKRLRIAERKMIARDKLRRELSMRKELERQERCRRDEELKKRKESMELANKEAMRSRASKSKAEHVRRKIAAALEDRQREMIQKFVEWARKESNRKKYMKEHQNRENEEKRRIVEEKWERRKEEEKKEIALRQSILHYANQQRETFIENYTKKIETDRARMQKRTKKYRNSVRCSVARGASGGKGRCRCRKSQKQAKDRNKASISVTEKSNTTLSKKRGNK